MIANKIANQAIQFPFFPLSLNAIFFFVDMKIIRGFKKLADISRNLIVIKNHVAQSKLNNQNFSNLFFYPLVNEVLLISEKGKQECNSVLDLYSKSGVTWG